MMEDYRKVLAPAIDPFPPFPNNAFLTPTPASASPPLVSLAETSSSLGPRDARSRKSFDPNDSEVIRRP